MSRNNTEWVCRLCGRTFMGRRGYTGWRRKHCSHSCARKAQNQRRGGIERESNPNWKGGRIRHAKGYVLIRLPEHPRASNGYVMEHILVVERKIGRPLRADECVHHINGQKDDNRPENLEVKSLAEHTREHSRVVDPAEALKLFQGGMSVQEVADKYGVLRGSMAKILRRQGADVPRARRIDLEAVLRLRSEGRSISEIARELGFTRQSIYNVASRRGLKL